MSLREQKATRTRTALIATARKLFAEHGYAQTSTDAILDGVGVKRGALYHHFRDKAALFEAVCLELHAEAAQVIEAAIKDAEDPVVALERGCIAWVRFMAESDARQILLVDAISVLGIARWNEMDARFGAGLLVEGIVAAKSLSGFDAESLAVLLNGATFAAANWLADDSTRRARLDAAISRLIHALR